ncbi:hypothetical protein B0F90DRAFT_1744934, partial [Multifurca ochricompacta]
MDLSSLFYNPLFYDGFMGLLVIGSFYFPCPTAKLSFNTLMIAQDGNVCLGESMLYSV